MPRLRESLPHLAVLAAALVAATLLSTHEQTAVSQALIWLPTGVGIAGVWLLGWRAALVVAAVTGVMRVGWPYALAQTLGAVCGSTAEAVLGAWMLRRAGLRGDFGRMRDVLALFATAAVAPLASIAASAVARALGGMPVVPLHGWESWWRMNVLAVLAIVPLALVWFAPEA